MARLTFDEIKQSKNFYRDNYYRVLKALLISIGAILFLLVAIAYVTLTQPAQRYYATNSVGFIDLLTPRSTPNMSSQALLPPDPPPEAVIKSMNFDTGAEQQPEQNSGQ